MLILQTYLDMWKTVAECNISAIAVFFYSFLFFLTLIFFVIMDFQKFSSFFQVVVP